MGATVFFSASLGAFILFLAFKLFERKRAISAYALIREKGDAAVLRAGAYVQQRAAYIEQQLSIRNVYTTLVKHVAVRVAHGARRVEEKAYDITRKMSRNGSARMTKSSFLQEVSTHKQNLDTERVRRETSLTDEHGSESV